MPIHPQLIQDLNKSRIIKVISGCLNNFEEAEIIEVVKAAELGKATYIDIAADAKIISLASQHTELPLCISSIILDQIFACIDNGIKIVEIGNFDAFYSNSMYFNINDIKNISLKVRKQYPNITICTTLPYILSLKEQSELAKYLENIGIDLLQTEGTINNKNINKYNNIPLKKSHSTLLTTYNLSKMVDIPIIAASGISQNNAKTAISYGAKGIGIKTAICKTVGLKNKIKLIQSIKTDLSTQFEHQEEVVPAHFLQK
nr:Ycf23 [Porphyropsis coccinea]